VYISNVPTDDWPTCVDAREPRVTRKAVGKRPIAEGHSQKRKSTNPLGTGGPLIIDDKESSWKRRKVMAGLTDDEEEEEETPLTRRQRAQTLPCVPTPPRAPTPL
jgi:hypothetical protein